MEHSVLLAHSFLLSDISTVDFILFAHMSTDYTEFWQVAKLPINSFLFLRDVTFRPNFIYDSSASCTIIHYPVFLPLDGQSRVIIFLASNAYIQTFPHSVSFLSLSALPLTLASPWSSHSLVAQHRLSPHSPCYYYSPLTQPCLSPQTLTVTPTLPSPNTASPQTLLSVAVSPCRPLGQIR